MLHLVLIHFSSAVHVVLDTSNILKLQNLTRQNKENCNKTKHIPENRWEKRTLSHATIFFLILNYLISGQPW